MWPAALVCSVIANVNRDSKRRSEPFTPSDFMPGARTEEDEMREFAEAVMRGDKFEPDPDAVALFRQKFLEECTPGYYNNEGKPSALAARNGPYGAGPIAFVKLLEDCGPREA